MRFLFKFAVALLMVAGLSHAQPASRRIALIIGNAEYTTPGWALKNPVNDARLIADRLRPLGFEVDLVTNADKVAMERAMERFGSRLRAAGPDAVGLFYYAGHGAEHDGANILVPVDIAASSVDELRYRAPPMQFLLSDMARAQNAVNIVILDACRNLPLPAGTRAGPAGGLAELSDVPDNILIAYATRPGLTAPDNPRESNSVFTRTLANALTTKAEDTVVNLFSDVQASVFTETFQMQKPEFRSGLLRAPGFRFASPTLATQVIGPATSASNTASRSAAPDTMARYRNDAAWDEHEGGFYRLTPTKMSYDEARRFARTQGGQLVTINDQQEQDFIYRAYQGHLPLWIGLSDSRAEGVWVWENGDTASYRNWKPGEPSGRLFGSFGSDEDFVVINPLSEGKWSDVNPRDMALVGNAYGIVEVRAR
ncbi:MAG: caspase family protein [Alphaproteobacteria bacterium]|nr:caspase family protein [Alphaproteobacteria bacterium]